MKALSYTPEQTIEMVKIYKDAKDKDSAVKQIAESFGKSIQSVRAKLVREKVYVAKTYTSKTGAKPESKAAKVQRIADKMGANIETVESLEKATKVALDKIIKHIGA